MFEKIRMRLYNTESTIQDTISTLISQGINVQEAERLTAKAVQLAQKKLANAKATQKILPKKIDVPIHENGNLKFTMEFDSLFVEKTISERSKYNAISRTYTD